jgi:hypothetical protein
MWGFLNLKTQIRLVWFYHGVVWFFSGFGVGFGRFFIKSTLATNILVLLRILLELKYLIGRRV